MQLYINGPVSEFCGLLDTNWTSVAACVIELLAIVLVRARLYRPIYVTIWQIFGVTTLRIVQARTSTIIFQLLN